jgi:hypothetical protein
MAMYLCRKKTDSSFPPIGEAFGRDHSTVIHAHNLIARRSANDSAFRFSIEKIERQLKATHANVSSSVVSTPFRASCQDGSAAFPRARFSCFPRECLRRDTGLARGRDSNQQSRLPDAS